MTYDPYERASEEERNEWAVRSQLYVARQLERLPDEQERRRKTLGALGAMKPRTGRCCRCGAPGERLVRITGDMFCTRCDPVAGCRARAGAWGCSIPVAEHRCACHTGGWLPHRFMRLEGDPG